jgi:2-hydroxy-3-oxopropionate reductase
MSTKKLRVGFIGIGTMGTPMSKNLLKAGFPLTVHDRVPEKTAKFADLGATVASSCAETARNVDVVLTIVGQVEEELEAVLGKGGVLEGAHPGLILIDMSTVGIVATEKIASAAREHGVGFLDATISGSLVPAQEATLDFMVGGDSVVLDKARPVLEVMSKRIYHVGPNGAGSGDHQLDDWHDGVDRSGDADTRPSGWARSTSDARDPR